MRADLWQVCCLISSMALHMMTADISICIAGGGHRMPGINLDPSCLTLDTLTSKQVIHYQQISKGHRFDFGSEKKNYFQ